MAKEKQTRRMIAMAMAAALTVSTLPVTAFAEEDISGLSASSDIKKASVNLTTQAPDSTAAALSTPKVLEKVSANLTTQVPDSTPVAPSISAVPKVPFADPSGPVQVKPSNKLEKFEKVTEDIKLPAQSQEDKSSTSSGKSSSKKRPKAVEAFAKKHNIDLEAKLNNFDPSKIKVNKELTDAFKEEKMKDLLDKGVIQKAPFEIGGAAQSGGGAQEQAMVSEEKSEALLAFLEAIKVLPTVEELQANMADGEYMKTFLKMARPLLEEYYALTEEDRAGVPHDVVSMLTFAEAEIANLPVPPSGEDRENGGYYTNPINENINLTLYNYGSYINVGEEKSLQFGWHNAETYPADIPKDKRGNYIGRPYEGIDGPAMTTDGRVFLQWADESEETKDIDKDQLIYYSNKIYNYPTVERMLNEDGYPQIAAYQMLKSNRNSNEVVDVSLEYLFPKDGPALNTGEATNPLSDYNNLRKDVTFIQNNGYNSNYESMRFEMEGDGGLFEKDENGYYRYNSSKQSVYFDQKNGQFLLSDTLITPSHYGSEYFKGAPSFAYNFMPFNKINFENTDQFHQFDDGRWVYATQFAKDGSVAEDLADLWFGFDMEFDFYVPKGGQVNGEDMEFYFNGDDDIWVYIDDVLILDIAGCHGAVPSWINFANGEVFNYNVGYSTGNSRKQYTTIKKQFEGALGADYVAEHMADQFTEEGAFVDYSKHTLKFFYTERGGNISYCELKFNMPALPSGSLSVGKEVEDTNGKEPAFIADALSYEFRVLKADDSGAATNELFIPAGASYKIVDANNYESVLGYGNVGEDGYFILKDGQVALFDEVLKTYGNAQYVVEERIPGKFAGAYGEVEYVADNESISTEVSTDGGETAEYLTYTTPALASDQTQKVTFTNKVKVDLVNSGGEGEGEGTVDPDFDPMVAALRITKTETGSTTVERQDTYQIRVLAGYSDDTMQPLSEGATYTVIGKDGEKETETIEDVGIIELEAGETAELFFLEGTSYKVEEVVNSEYTYYPSYEGATGSIAVDGTKDVSATVINTYYVPSSGGNGGSNNNNNTNTNSGNSSNNNDDEEGMVLGAEDVAVVEKDIPEEKVPMAAPEEGMVLGAEDERKVLGAEEASAIPQTGDDNHMTGAFGAMLASLAGMFMFRKKKETK